MSLYLFKTHQRINIFLLDLIWFSTFSTHNPPQQHILHIVVLHHKQRPQATSTHTHNCLDKSAAASAVIHCLNTRQSSREEAKNGTVAEKNFSISTICTQIHFPLPINYNTWNSAVQTTGKQQQQHRETCQGISWLTGTANQPRTNGECCVQWWVRKELGMICLGNIFVWYTDLGRVTWG